jgi:hypothetical protein
MGCGGVADVAHIARSMVATPAEWTAGAVMQLKRLCVLFEKG